MKRKLILTLSAVLLLTVSGAILTRILYSNHNTELLSLSLESLTDGELPPTAHCTENNDTDCVFACPNPNCNKAYFAEGHTGQAYGITGYCMNCGTAF